MSFAMVFRAFAKVNWGLWGQTYSISCVGGGEIPLLGEMSRSDKGVMAQP